MHSSVEISLLIYLSIVFPVIATDVITFPEVLDFDNAFKKPDYKFDKDCEIIVNLPTIEYPVIIALLVSTVISFIASSISFFLPL